MAPSQSLPCPFCPFEDDDLDFLRLHVQTLHPERMDPGSTVTAAAATDTFMNRESPEPRELREQSRQCTWPSSSSPPSPSGRSDTMAEQGDDGGEEEGVGAEREGEVDYIECFCGELCLQAEFDTHLEMHNAEQMGFDLPNSLCTELSSMPTTFVEEQKITPGTTTSQYQTSHRPTSSRQMEKSDDRQSDPAASSSKSRIRERHDDGTKRRVPSETSSIRSRSTQPSHASGRRHRRPKAEKPAQRLGKIELGPYAWEEQMPSWLRHLLEKGGKVTVKNAIGPDGRLVRRESVANEIRGVVPVLSQLCAQDESTARVYLCHPDVTYITKMAREGGFCGYRNIQMLISFIQNTRAPGYQHFVGRTPPILLLQDMIESAWDRGFGAVARIETGGIRGTRKYIGTPEAQALFESLQIDCIASAFRKSANAPAHLPLLQTVEKYFMQGIPDPVGKINQTSLAPLYFQYPGHSLTIVGFEKTVSGETNLLVFDPMFQASPGIRRLVGARFRSSAPGDLLKAYRRGKSHIGKYDSFEILRLGLD